MLECTKCKKEKDKSEFRERKNLKRGYHSWCKDCERAAGRKRYRPKPPKPKKVLTDEDKANLKLEARKRMLKHRYDLTYKEYVAMYDKQDGECAICKTPKRLGGRRGLHVDHDHETGEVRGLLCNPCNTAIGKFKDNIEFLESAIKYLDLK